MKYGFLFALCLLALLAFKTEQKKNVWLVGDSTMAAKKPERDPESGWGVELPSFFGSKATVHNLAASGRSTKSYIKERRWSAVADSIQPGDYVIIQFGHNDEKLSDSMIYAAPFTDYKHNLKKFVMETRAKGGNPIICSPIVRRHFDSTGQLMDTHGDYLKAAREVARETEMPFVDMEAATRKLVAGLGPEKSKLLYVFCAPGECPARKRGVQDSTHLNHEGSRQVASLFVEAVKKQKLPLAKLLE